MPGVSKDSVGSHKKSEESHGLPFKLLSDAVCSVKRENDEPEYIRAFFAGSVKRSILLSENLKEK